LFRTRCRPSSSVLQDRTPPGLKASPGMGSGKDKGDRFGLGGRDGDDFV
jgi:hypothetical protein